MRKALLVTGILAAAIANADTASACGGFFEPPAPPTLADAESAVARVAGQRWIYAVSPERTTLYAELTYRGAPSKFAWVLPVKGTPDVGVGHAALFEAFEHETAMRVESPTVFCPGSPGGSPGSSGGGCGLGCMGSAAFPDSDGGYTGGGGRGDAGQEIVEVVRTQTVGPYETVIVRSSVPTALVDWLEANGYAIPDHVRPIIAEYTQEGFDFLAVRFQDPEAGAQIMQPIRVSVPGPATTIPARMAAAGSGPLVPVVLYTVTGGPMAIPTFQPASIDLASLEWDWNLDRSNYPALLEKALTEGAPKSYTSYAKRNPWASIGDSYRAVVGGPCNLSALIQGAKVVRTCERIGDPDLGDASTDGGSADGGAEGGTTDAGPMDAGDDGGTTTLDPRPCKDPTLVTVDQLSCDPSSTDLGELLLGQVPSDAWVTRLELRLPRGTTPDLRLEPSGREVDNSLQATQSKGSPCRTASNEPPTGTGSNATAFALVGLGFAAWRRRQSRR